MVKKQSNKNPCSRETFPELSWRTAFFLFKNPVEIRYVVKPAVIGHFSNGIGGLNEDAAGVSQADFRQTVDKSIARPLTKKPAERDIGHVGQFRNL